jgi:hypothetical protein
LFYKCVLGCVRWIVIIRNDGYLPQFYITDAHEPIVSRETFEAAQEEIQRRGNQRKASSPATERYPFTGLIRCGKCGAIYRRKHAAAGSKYEKIVWICGTFNTLGKAECDSQQIPEDILWDKVAEVGGLDNIAGITVPGKFRLLITLKDGEQHEAEWQHRSRRESWTDEMKAVAAEKARERHARS